MPIRHGSSNAGVVVGDESELIGKSVGFGAGGLVFPAGLVVRLFDFEVIRIDPYRNRFLAEHAAAWILRDHADTCFTISNPPQGPPINRARLSKTSFD